MKIAFVSDAVYPWNIGGLETLESTESHELAKKHEVHFFSLKWPGMEKDFVRDRIHYHTLHEISNEKFYRHGRRSIRESIVYSLGLARIFFYKFDYIQSNEFPILQIPMLRLYCKLTGCKLILDMHEVWDREYWYVYLGRFGGTLGSFFASTVLKMADGYVVNSSVTAHRLGNLGVPERKIHIFSPVIDDKTILGIKSARESKTVIFSGRLIKEKRVDKLLEVVKLVSARVKGMRAIIIGEGPERLALERMVKRMSLSGIVEIRDFYKTEDKSEIYRRIKESKVFLQMSEREGLSIIVLESLALGTPVLLPDYSPIPEEVKSMCVVRDEMSLPYQLESMLNSPDKRKFLKNASGLERFSASKTNKFYLRMFAMLRRT